VKLGWGYCCLPLAEFCLAPVRLSQRSPTARRVAMIRWSCWSSVRDVASIVRVVILPALSLCRWGRNILGRGVLPTTFVSCESVTCYLDAREF
jgi:hypothetical protein